MRPGLGSNKDFLAGLIFLLIGALAVVVALGYPMGSAMRMGPGYFPAVLGGILVLFGVFLAARGIVRGAPLEIEWGWRPLAAIALAMVLFGFLMSRAGLVPALAAALFVSALGGREFRIREALVLSAVMTAFAVGVFVYGLKLPYRLLAGF